MSEFSAEHTNIVAGSSHQLDAALQLIQQHPTRRSPVVVLERKLAMSSTMFDTAVVTSDHRVQDTRTVKRTCHEVSRRKTDNDLPSVQPASETLMAKISRFRSAANAAVTAASGAS